MPTKPRRAATTPCALAALAILAAAAGCRPAGTDSAAAPLLVIGSRGHASGRFNLPRGIDRDPPRGLLYVVDWDGRVQKFTEDGAFRASWVMPLTRKGTPEDLCVAPGGNVLVADTHYSRVLEFDPAGRVVRTFGSYGREAGQFIYPVGICCTPQGTIYVTEYGGNDRVQKFKRDGTFLRAWGQPGTEPGRFQRPSGIDVCADGLVAVADAVNHRVQVFTPDGELRHLIGREGSRRGCFRYPYDVAATGRALFVLEYGNQRAQKVTREGRCLAVYGGPGRRPGRFSSPWRCTADGDLVLVSDTYNHRVVKLDTSL